jgi:glycosyltransferase involved in cell wall biosynthesis
MITYSVVIPLKDESQSLSILYHELKKALDKLCSPYELIFIDDGSTDNSFSILTKLQKEDKKIKIIKFRANFGKSHALSQGFHEAKGEIIITLDADLQDDPNDIPKFIAKINDGYDLVSGWRKKRADGFIKRISSFLFNKGTSLMSGVKIHDFNCGFKVFKKEVADELYLRGELHRFIPVLAAKNRFKVSEVVVNNRTRTFGQSKYGKFGIQRGWKGTIDLLTAIFIADYSTKPGHFFGVVGLLFFLIGFFMDLYVVYIKIATGTTQAKLPMLIAGVLFILLGVQLISTGLIAEMIVSFNKHKKK